ncbi:MAG TPA: branched-chain amino acid ABC transporter substrate-binding protein [Alphaproteobacteria bacterium]|nr:branched-chain amino acid ABC transporter substrate-binding protein [Alphaproteobacteria bacterium]
MRILFLALLLFAAPLAHADIEIAMVAPLTGSAAAAGEQIRDGSLQAIEDLNAAGGVLGQKLHLSLYDDVCDPKQAVSIANQLASNPPAVVIGHYCSGSSIPASDVYFDEGILMISPGSTNPKLTEAGRWDIFRVCGRDDQQGQVGGQALAKLFPGKKIAIVDDRQTYSQGLADETRKALNAAGVKEALDDTVTPGEKDYSALVAKLKQAGIDVLYYAGYPIEAGSIVRQMRGQGMNTVMVAGDALVSRDFWAITGPAGEGTLVTFSPDPTHDPKNAAIVAKLKAAGRLTEGYSLFAYAAIQAWAEAATKAGSTDPHKVADILHSGTFDTVRGQIRFDRKGDVVGSNYVLYRWHDGAYSELGR